ncbi:MAG: sugar ABC transporter ATP-binding protein [Synergistaceae bacterium]|jgi:ABC-type sugar transport system ATPase subunit|nr:sugar ABC transporter ATP-binding protein [Synergistaceae bacterium]
MDYCLEMRGISKQFVGLKALDDVSFYLKQGEVRALLGINGAGKSTLIKILSGVYRKDSGTIILGGKQVEINSADDALKLGISCLYQDAQMVDSITGYENIYLGNENESKNLFSPISRKKLKSQALELLKKYPLEVNIDKPVYLLSAVEREIIAVLRALSKDCKILVLDEPTSVLTEKEKDVLFDLIRTLKSRGVSIIYITHHLDEVEEICDSFSIFRNGRNIADEDISNNKVDPKYIAELMIGEKLEQLYPPRTKEYLGGVEFEARDICVENKLRNISFQARRGEVFGIFGLVGSGIDELSKVLFGAMKMSRGEILKSGRMLDMKSPEFAIENGVFLVPGNRKTEGQLPGLSISFNISIAKIKKLVKGLFVDTRLESKETGNLAGRLAIVTPSLAKHANELSGGNQQKVVVGKGLFTDADVYIFCEPTVGVDVGAKESIYKIIRELAKNSLVIVISSDPDEVLGISDRVLVMYKGAVTMEREAEKTGLKEMLVHAVIGGEEAKGGSDER